MNQSNEPQPKTLGGYLFHCDCPGFTSGIGVHFDSQDARNGNWTVCPYCNKPFEPIPASSDIAKKLRLNVTVGDGKYTVQMHDDGVLVALRYGQPWRECIGDNLILALASEVESLTLANASRDKEIERLKRRLNDAELLIVHKFGFGQNSDVTASERYLTQRNCEEAHALASHIKSQLTAANARIAELEADTFRYSHDEIENACGGEVALSVREKVMRRRKALEANLRALKGGE